MAGVLTNEIGKIVISNEVIAKIAGLAAMECYGIVGMSATKATDGLADLLKIENIEKGIKISFNDNALKIDLFVIVEHGTSISTVATNVIDTVKYKVESTTGFHVDLVNINIMGIRV